MFTRPKKTDSEDDILRMQEEFIKEKQKKTFEAAAQVKVVHGKKKSLYALSRGNLQPADHDNIKIESSSETASSAQMNFVIGEVFEKNPDNCCQIDKAEEPIRELENFPKVKRIGIRKNVDGKSLFAMSMERKRHQMEQVMDTEPDVKHIRKTSDNTTDTKILKEIHEENVSKLAQMDHNEIMSERAQLLQSMDPKLIEFIAEKRLQNQNNTFKASLLSCKEETNEASETKTSNAKETSTITTVENILSSNDSANWINFHVFEKEKLEWMRELPKMVKKLKPNESFEARFDWKGVLLPYIEEDTGKDNRDLYLHGDEPFRPGYTLQELFRLARSDIMQQRISAFTCIGCIINIYNQGFYDGIFELPFGKLFFLLRFGLDENLPALLEVVSKALSLMFYNDNDETILDLMFESSEGAQQPMLLCTNQISFTKDDASEIENQLRNLKLTTTSPLTAKIEENEEDSKASMNDFQLAETDLVQCLIQTNIIQRICYILGTVKSDNSTVLHCLKILIRIARSNKQSALKIAENDELISILHEHFLPKTVSLDCSKLNGKQFYNIPQTLVLKLFRVLLVQHSPLYIKFASLDLFQRIKDYLSFKEDFNTHFIKVQIESLRVVRTLFMSSLDINFYMHLLPSICYMLEWHFRHTFYEHNAGPPLIRQHATALISTIASGSVEYKMKQSLSETLSNCFCKWFFEATKHGISEFSQSMLLSSSLTCVKAYTKGIKDTCFDSFFKKYLPDFLKSSAFCKFQEPLISSSILLNKSSDRQNSHPPLSIVGAVLLDNSGPKLIFSQNYPVFLLHSLFEIVNLKNHGYDKELINCLLTIDSTKNLFDYLKKLTTSINRQLVTNHFAKCEIELVFNLLTSECIQNFLTNGEILCAAYNFLTLLTSDKVEKIEIVFDKIIFTKKILNFNQQSLSKWKKIFLTTFVNPYVCNYKNCYPVGQSPILPMDWPYLLLKNLLHAHLQPTMQDNVNIGLSEREALMTTLIFTKILEEYSLQITSPTEQLMYFMIMFLGQNSDFLEPEVNAMLTQHINMFYDKFRNYDFQFEEIFEDKCKFENLYILFLEHFQAASYGDALFGSLLIIPLANKYNIKYRKMVWSEHASVLRFLNLSENQLLGQSLDAYINPPEEDDSLLQNYAMALNSNILHKDSIPFKIATHHIEKAKQRRIKTIEKKFNVKMETT